MSLAGDFSMYFGGTVVLTATGLPFRVQNVDGGRGGQVENLRFYGDVILDSNGRRDGREIRHSDLNFDLPTLGWRMINNNPRWVTYKPFKTVKKGLHYVRVDGMREGDFSRQNIWNLFQTFEGRISDDWCVLGEDVMFKRMLVGHKTGDERFELVNAARYLAPRLERLVPGSNIIISA